MLLGGSGLLYGPILQRDLVKPVYSRPHARPVVHGLTRTTQHVQAALTEAGAAS